MIHHMKDKTFIVEFGPCTCKFDTEREAQIYIDGIATTFHVLGIHAEDNPIINTDIIKYVQ